MKRVIVSIVLIALAVSVVIGVQAFSDWKEMVAKRAFIEGLRNEQEKIYLKALNLYRNGDYDGAVRLLIGSESKAARALLELARRKARDYHIALAKRFNELKRFEDAAREYAKALGYDPKNKKLKELSEGSTIRRTVDETIHRISDASPSGKHSYSRGDVTSYSITGIQKSGNTAKVYGTATMKDGNMISGCASLAKIGGKWIVTGYSY